MNFDYRHTEFDLHSLYRTVFGYKALPFPAGDINVGNYLPSFPIDTINAIANQFKKTATGTYIIVPLRMSAVNDVVMHEFPIEVMVKIQAKQRMIKRYTHHLSNKGSIKEQWGLDDYSIDIRGMLFSKEDELGMSDLVKENIKKLDEFLEEGLIKIDCPLLELFDIQYMAIESMNFPFDRGGLEIIPFEIKGVSDFRQDELLELI